MKQILQNYKTGELKIEEVPVPFLKRGGVLVRNRFSLVSAGTERSMTELAQRGIVGKAKERPDIVRQVIGKARKDGIINTVNAVKTKLDVVKPLGYSSAGRVVSVGKGVDEFLPNDRVACAGAGYANHADFVFVPKNLCVGIPENVSDECAACATIGAVALQGVRAANPLLGERVAVIGLGFAGQLTVQLLMNAGCTVFGVDVDAVRVETAVRAGMDRGVSDMSDVTKWAKAFSQGYGMDAVIITASTRSNGPVELAGEISRDRGRIVVVGNVGTKVPRDLFYKKELDLRISRSYGPGRYDAVYEEDGIDYPFGYVRWTEKRNIEIFLGLISQGKLNIDQLITHQFPVAKAATVYDLLGGRLTLTDDEVARHERKGVTNISDKQDANVLLGVLFEYEDGLDEGETRLQVKKDERSADMEPAPEGSEFVAVGLIGAGNFVKTTLLPALKDTASVRLKGLAAATGSNARISAEKHSFEYCTTDYTEILNDEDVDCVIIATRHDLHARLAIEALQCGKDALVEKPLAITEDELSDVVGTWQGKSRRLMVGFNRRFSPFTVSVKEFFGVRENPLVMNYRINAGFIDRNHWVHNPDVGGGRIVGEVCHFVDLLQYITGSRPVKVYAEMVLDFNFSNDNVNVTLKFEDGSIGSITYLSCGDKMFSKERIEVFGDGAAAVIDDFRSGCLIKDGKSKRIKARKNDKGHRDELREFVSAVRDGVELPVPFDESVTATAVTFAILESIREGRPVLVDDCGSKICG